MDDVGAPEFGYALYELPPRSVPFRRWRWELWEGARLVACGWRLSRSDAARAVRFRAAELAHPFVLVPRELDQAGLVGVNV
jgi:hypothetical protein